MISKTFLFIVILAFGRQVYSQAQYTPVTNEEFINFHNMVSSAERMFKNDSLLQAYAKYDIAFNSYKGPINPTHYYKATMCALRIKEEFKALNFLQKAVTSGYDFDTTKDVIVFYNQNTKKEYAANRVKWEKEKEAGRNYEWQGQLYSTIDANKKYNTGTYKAATEYCVACMKNPKCNKTLPEYTSKYRLVKEKMKADSITAATLLANIQKYGFPTMKILDKGSCEIARAILLNYDYDKTNSRLNGMLSKALINGQISPSFYAQVVDRRNLYNGFPPEFYEPVLGYEKLTAKEFGPANLKRKSIGLYPIMLPKVSDMKGMNLSDPAVVAKYYGSLYDY
jgi:hypothetical protein